MCQCYSLNFSHPLLPPLCPHVHFICLCLYSCSAKRFISTIFFLDSIHMFYICIALIYNMWFSLSDLLHAVWHTLSSSTSLQIIQFHSFLWLGNIPLYICILSSLSIHLSMTFRLLHIQAIVNSSEMNTGVRVSFWIVVFSGYVPTSGLLCPMVVFVFQETSILFPFMAVSVSIPTNSVKRFPFFHTPSSIYCL